MTSPTSSIYTYNIVAGGFRVLAPNHVPGPLYIYMAASYLGGLLLADLFVSFKNLKQ